MIEIMNLNVKKGNKFLLKNINLKVEKFGLNGIIGANGAGKSTFLRSFLNKNLDSNFKQNFGHALLLNTKQKDKNSSGIYFNGTNLWELNYKEKSKFISFLPQFMEFLDIEIDEFLTLSRRKFCGNFLNKKDREKITKIVNDFNLNTILHAKLSTLSGGNRAKVFIAGALLEEPKVLLLDEPISHLDPKNQHAILRIVRDFALQEQIFAFVVIHDLTLALNYTQNSLFFKKGELVNFKANRDICADDLSVLFDTECKIYEFEGEKIVTFKG